MPDDANNDADVYEAALDPADDTPDLNDAQQTLQQDQQAEAQAAAAGDYATANNDAQLAYGDSQDVANAGGPDNTDATWEAAQDASWANADQQTADQDALTADSYAADTSGNPETDAADAALYGGDAQSEEATADDSAAAAVDDAPVDDTAVADDAAPVDDTATDDDSSAS
jgi:hypothetical protein